MLFLYEYQTSDENNLEFRYSLHKFIQKLRKNYIYFNNLFQLYYNTEVRRNNEPIFLFNCLPISLLLYYIYRDISIHNYVYIMLHKMKNLCFTTDQGTYTFLAANCNKSRSN